MYLCTHTLFEKIKHIEKQVEISKFIINLTLILRNEILALQNYLNLKI